MKQPIEEDKHFGLILLLMIVIFVGLLYYGLSQLK